MKPPRFLTLASRRARARVRDLIPSFDSFEERQLLSGFLQGTVVDPNNNPLSGATVDLYNSSNALVGTVVTGSGGYYQFNNLTAGTYDLMETPPGTYTGDGTSAVSPINPVQSTTAMGASTSVVVRVDDIAGFTSVNFNTTNFFNANGNDPKAVTFDLNQDYASTGAASFVGENLYVAQLPSTATYTESPAFTTPLFSSYCVDALHGLDDGNNVFPVDGQEIPTALDSSTTGIDNAGSIAYLYNTYGSSPSVLSDPIQMGGLQIALWEMVYNQFTGPVTAAQLAAGNNLEDFQPSANASAADVTNMLNDAAADINQSLGQSQLAVYLALNGSPASGGEQGQIVSSVINFTNQPKSSPTISTQASESNGGVVGTATLSDSATLVGGNSPTGTISFTLTAPDGTTTPEGSVTVSGDGSYSSPSVLATEVGTYTWHATYSGDSLNNGASDNGANEGVATTQASPTIVTQASESNGGVVGTAMLSDSAALSGGYDPTGTIDFTLTAPDGTTTPEGSVTVSGDGSYSSPSVLATEVGVYTWHASYSGDINNSPASDNGANEGMATTQASPTINTQASESNGGVVGIAMLTDSATLSDGYNPTGTISFSLTAPDGTTVPEGSVTVTGDGSYSSPSVLATEVGTYTWHASYSGDTNNSPASDNGANEGVTTIMATPAINTQASETNGCVVGIAMLSDSATLTGGYNPTGSISFTLTAPDGTTTPEGSVTVTGDGSYSSPSVLATEVGVYTWHASYSGDSDNSPASDNGANEGVTTIMATPAINTQASETNGGVVGIAMLTDSATLSDGYNPTGTISFSLTAPDGTTVPEGSVTVTGDGSYSSPSVLATEVGTYTWHASYSGDTDNSPASDDGANEGVTTIMATPAINTRASETNGCVVGVAMLTDSATLSGGYNPTGTISFTLTAPDGTTVPEGSVKVTGDAIYSSPSVLATEVGVYTWHASYSGDTNNSPASDNGANEGVTTTKASPTIATAASITACGVVGSAVLSDSAVLSGGYDVTGGKITFTLTAPDGTTAASETVNVNGDGTYSTPTAVTATEVGTYTWHASYTGDGLNSGAVDNGVHESLTTVKAGPVIATTPNQTAVPQGTATTLKDTATLSGGYNETGTITFTLISPSGKTLDTETVGVKGNGTYTTPTGYALPSSAAAGVYQWNATYTGDGDDNAAVDLNDPSERVAVITPCCNLQDIAFNVYNSGGQLVGTYSDLRGNTQQGDTVTVSFTVPSGDYDQLSLVSYDAPESFYSANDANLQTVDESVTKTFGPGTYTNALSVPLPDCFYQVDFVCGAVITTLGPAGSNNFYSAQDRLISADNGGVNPCMSSELEISGTVYCDMNVDGKFDGGDQGLAGVTVTLTGTDAYGNAISETTTTASNGTYSFAGMPFSNASGYTVTMTTPSGDFSGTATVGSLGGSAATNPEAVNTIVMSTASHTNGTGYNFGVLMPSSLSGEVYDDGKDDCHEDSCDQGLAGVTVTLTGTNDQGVSVTASTTTNGSGDYTFTGLAPGTYKVTVTPPGGFTADADSVGTVGGKTDGNAISDAAIASIVLEGCTSAGINYDFSLVGSGAGTCQTQTSSYWCGSQGQALIKCLNGGSTQTGLGNWLAATCPNLFGSLKGCTNSQVASYCKTLSGGNANQQACGQVLATALCAYVTDSDLAGSAGASYGFTVTANGLGANTWNVGTNGSGLGLSNHQSYSILALLQQVDSQSKNGALNSSASSAAGSLFSSINQY